MLPPYEVPRISVSDASLAGADVDLIIIPVAQDDAAAAAQRCDAPLGDDLRSAIERGEFRGKPNEIYVAAAPAAGWRADARGVRGRWHARRPHRRTIPAHGRDGGADGAAAEARPHRLGGS